jgi:uncharacterized protein
MSYRDALMEYVRSQALPVEKYGHQPRLYALTLQVGASHSYDDDVVFAAAWLHDLGVFTGHRPEDLEALAKWDSVAYSLDRAPGILTRLGFPAAKIPAVLDAIATHQPKDQPTSMEGIILRDADILEQLGAVGILRAVCKVGRDTRFPTFTDAVASIRRALDVLPAKLALGTSRALAERKIRATQEFLTAVEAEAQGALY